MSDEKQVAIKKEAGLPSSILFEEDAAAGFENVKTVSLALPILKLLQNGSGEAQRRNQNYVEGAEPCTHLPELVRELLHLALGAFDRLLHVRKAGFPIYGQFGGADAYSSQGQREGLREIPAGHLQLAAQAPELAPDSLHLALKILEVQAQDNFHRA